MKSIIALGIAAALITIPPALAQESPAFPKGNELPTRNQYEYAETLVERAGTLLAMSVECEPEPDDEEGEGLMVDESLLAAVRAVIISFGDKGPVLNNLLEARSGVDSGKDCTMLHQSRLDLARDISFLTRMQIAVGGEQ